MGISRDKIAKRKPLQPDDPVEAARRIWESEGLTLAQQFELLQQQVFYAQQREFFVRDPGFPFEPFELWRGIALGLKSVGEYFGKRREVPDHWRRLFVDLRGALEMRKADGLVPAEEYEKIDERLRQIDRS